MYLSNQIYPVPPNNMIETETGLIMPPRDVINGRITSGTNNMNFTQHVNACLDKSTFPRQFGIIVCLLFLLFLYICLVCDAYMTYIR